MAIEDLLKGLLEGAVSQGAGRQQARGGEGDELADLLGGILGGGATAQPGEQMPTQQGGLGDLIGAILGGGATSPQGQQAPQQGGDLGDLIGAIMGGGATSPQSQQMPTEGGDLGDLIGAIMGGEAASQQGQQTPTPQGGLGDLIGAILGGGQSGGALSGILGSILGGTSARNNAVLAPITEAISERLGLSPSIAQAVVLFAATTIIPALIRGVARKEGASLPAQARLAPSAGTAEGGLDLDDLLQRMGTHQALASDYLQSTGLAQQLAAQTGLDTETATQSLQQTLLMFSDYLDEGDVPRASSKRRRASKSQGLDDLLETWDKKR